MNREQTEQIICAAICKGNGLKVKEIIRQLNLDRSAVKVGSRRSKLVVL